MRILITGGAGFIGSHVAAAYTAAGHQVAVLDDFSGGKQENLHGLAEVTIFRASITDTEAVRGAFSQFKPEVVSHHAAQVSVVESVRDPLRDENLNVKGLVTVLEACRASEGFQKFIFVSSAGTVYGVPEQLPCTEEAPANPGSFYGLTKYIGEQYVHMYEKLFGLKATILPYSNVYGPRQDPHGEAGVCAIFAKKMLAGQAPTIFGDGNQVRDYVYVADVAAANVAVLQKGDGETFNVSTGVGTSTRQIFNALKAEIGFAGEPVMAEARAGELQRIYVSSDKAQRELKWKPRYALADGIRETVSWYGQER